MRITGVSIKNVLGVQELSLEPGQITKITGENGSGKSSVLAALQAGIGGGSLANLKRVGSADEPEVVIVFDDGAYRLERKGDNKLRVRQRVGESAAYEDVRRPQAFLDALYDGALANPVAFLTAHPNTRTDLLLEALPLQLDRAALMATIGEAWPEGKTLPEGHPLAVVSAARAILFDERTGVNRSQKDKSSSAYELQKALPAEMPEDPAAALREAGAERDDLFRKLAAKKADADTAYERARETATAAYEATAERVRGEFKTAAAKIRGAADTKIETLRTELERQIASIKEETEAAVAEVKANGEKLLAVADENLVAADDVAAEARREAFAVVDALQPDLQRMERRVAELQGSAENVAKLRRTKELADKFQGEAESLKAVSERLTKAIDTVEAFKARLLKDLPIEGLELRGREIYINGVPWDQVNTAARVKVAVTIARLRAKAQLPLLFLDGAESLDAEHFKLLEEELRAAGVQAIVARVEEGPLTIETNEPSDSPRPTADVVPMPQAANRRRRSVLVE